MSETKLTFTGEADFEAKLACERFLEERGFSVGSWQRGSPCGVMFGDYDISKWRNMLAREKAALHGHIYGDGRRGPVTLTINDTCPPAGRAALSHTAEG